MLGKPYLVGATSEQMLTFPGQAAFAAPELRRHCRDCSFWAPRRKNSAKGRCDKATAMVGEPTPLVPGDAMACKYFVEPPRIDEN